MSIIGRSHLETLKSIDFAGVCAQAENDGEDMSKQENDQHRWGQDDQKGAMNLVTPEVTLKAIQSVKHGRMIDLSHELKSGHPMLPTFMSPFLMSIWSDATTSRRMLREHMDNTNDFGVFTERVELCTHTSTHVDALGHVTIGDEMYNGFSSQDSVNSFGLERLGIEQMPPAITRGVSVDLAGLDGGEFLEGGRSITTAELKDALSRAKVQLQPGDIFFFRTGYSRYYMTDNRKYIRSAPGIDVDAARWLTGQGVAAIGADNMAVEVTPYPEKGAILPVHQHTLVEAGVHLVENLALDGLMQSDVTTFCLIMIPIKITGATGCPLRPVALI